MNVNSSVSTQLNVNQFKTNLHGVLWDEGVCEGAAFSGNLELLQWARADGAYWNERVCVAATLSAELDILHWAFRNGIYSECNHFVLDDESFRSKLLRRIIKIYVLDPQVELFREEEVEQSIFE